MVWLLFASCARRDDVGVRRQGTLTTTLKDVRPTSILGVPRVWEKIAEKMKEIGKNTTGLKRRIAMWAKDIGYRGNISLQSGWVGGATVPAGCYFFLLLKNRTAPCGDRVGRHVISYSWKTTSLQLVSSPSLFVISCSNASDCPMVPPFVMFAVNHLCYFAWKLQIAPSYSAAARKLLKIVAPRLSRSLAHLRIYNFSQRRT